MKSPKNRNTLWLLAFVLPLLAGRGLAEPERVDTMTGQRLELKSGWLLQSSALVSEGGETLSSTGYQPGPWIATSLPTTVLSALVASGIYPDPRIGLNAYRIPDSSEDFNARHNLARFSYLPDGRNPWRDPYWFRREFDLPPLASGRRAWLHFDAINYRAEVWLNGHCLATPDRMAGAFQRFAFDITAHARPGRNTLAVKVYPVDHPGTPDTQGEVLGPDRGYQKEIMKDVTEVMSIGYDCMMTVPDRNMGLWQPVWIDFSGPVSIRNPFVVTRLPLPDTSFTTLTVSAELVNAAATPVRGTLRGEVAGTGLRFERPVELAPQETKAVTFDPSPVLRQPRLWWPRGQGEQYLYNLVLTFEAAGAADGASDRREVRFGVREVSSQMREINGYYGRRVLINGRKVFCRGGYIQPDLLLDCDARRMEAEIRYYAEAGLNLIYFEDIPNPPDPFLELCDRYGIMFGACHYACGWARPGTTHPLDPALLERCTVDLIKRYRNHPSLIMYMAMNEEDTRRDVYVSWRRLVLAQDGTRWFIPSAFFPSDRKDVPEWFKNDLPAGMTDKGASYSWAEPANYFRWVDGGRNWMFMMEGGSASLPPISSLSRFLPDLAEAAPGPRFPLTRDWAHHGANHYFKGYDSALRRLLGEPDNVTDYCWKGHLLTADQHRSIYEAVSHRMWEVTSGLTEWKLNSCEPSVQWQIFDWYLKPMVSYYFIKKACEPLHVQLNLADRRVCVINNTKEARTGMEVAARVYDLNAKERWTGKAMIDAPASAYHESLVMPTLPDLGPLYFVKLELRDAYGGLLSDNFYWLPDKEGGELKPLEQLPPVKLEVSYTTETRGEETIVRARVANPGGPMAFFIQLAVTRGRGGEEVLPVIWSDNYFSLTPGETREVTARLATNGLTGAATTLEAGGWNIQTDYECTNLTLDKPEVRAGESVSVTAAIARTFLDGSRVTLLLDGRPAGSRWAWARTGRQDHITFKLPINTPGRHELRIGSQTTHLTAH